MSETVEVFSEVGFLKHRLEEAKRANAELGIELDEALTDVAFWRDQADGFRRFWLETSEKVRVAEREKDDVLKLLAQTMRKIHDLAGKRSKVGKRVQAFILSKGPLPPKETE
jgi:predicted S18 family serine protease